MPDAFERFAMLADTGAKVIGMKQVIKGLSGGSIHTVFLASDADAFIVEAVDGAAREQGAAVYYVPSKSELGKRAGIQVDAACVGIAGK